MLLGWGLFLFFKGRFVFVNLEEIIMYLYPYLSPALGRDFFYIGKVA